MGGYSVPGGSSYLQVSLDLLAKFNPEINFEVILAHWEGHGELLDFPGSSNMKISCDVYRERDIPRFKELSSVEQHGVLLNHVLNGNPTTAPYTLILDPDFFFFTVNVVSDLISQMRSSRTGTIGVSYPARYPIEYSWKYPQVYFLLVDNKIIDLSEVNFKSGLSGLEIPENYIENHCLETRILKFLAKNNTIQQKFPKCSMILVQLAGMHSKRARIDPRDTGWRFPQHLQEGLFEVLPNIVEPTSGSILLFNSDKFLKDNLIPDGSIVTPEWIFLSRGLVRRMSLRSQNIFFRVAFSVLCPRVKVEFLDKWPSSSVIESTSLLGNATYDVLKGKLKGADFYSFNRVPFGVHLGHKGKASIDSKPNELKLFIEGLN